MTLLTVVNAKRSGNGNDLAGVAANVAGDTFPNTGREVVVIKNASVGAITVTVPTTGTVDGLAIADLTASIGAGETRMLGPFPPSIYSADGQPGEVASLSYSDVTTLTVTVVKV